MTATLLRFKKHEDGLAQHQDQRLDTALRLLAEALVGEDGRHAEVDHRSEYCVVLLMRSPGKSSLPTDGNPEERCDTRLAHVVSAMHAEPEKDWSLASLARVAGMSRSRFAAHFLASIGHTPFEYLTQRRISAAQRMLKRGEPLKMVAPAVGYSSSAALSRAFCQQVGSSPTAWLLADSSASRLSLKAAPAAALRRLQA